MALHLEQGPAHRPQAVLDLRWAWCYRWGAELCGCPLNERSPNPQTRIRVLGLGRSPVKEAPMKHMMKVHARHPETRGSGALRQRVGCGFWSLHQRTLARDLLAIIGAGACCNSRKSRKATQKMFRFLTITEHPAASAVDKYLRLRYPSSAAPGFFFTAHRLPSLVCQGAPQPAWFGLLPGA